MHRAGSDVLPMHGVHWRKAVRHSSDMQDVAAQGRRMLKVGSPD